jgi:hypothetical protein
MLTWDVIVLNGYLDVESPHLRLSALHALPGRRPNPKWYIPFVFLSIMWAISIHTVTAFLYCGLGSRPFWNTALLAPRFLTSAFVSGPAFIIVAIQIMRRRDGFNFGNGPIRTLVNIMRVTILINLLMLISEVFVEFYTGGTHTSSAHYLYFGIRLFEREDRSNACPFGGGTCGVGDPCPLHHKLVRVNEAIQDVLHHSTFEEFHVAALSGKAAPAKKSARSKRRESYRASEPRAGGTRNALRATEP